MDSYDEIFNTDNTEWLGATGCGVIPASGVLVADPYVYAVVVIAAGNLRLPTVLMDLDGIATLIANAQVTAEVYGQTDALADAVATAVIAVRKDLERIDRKRGLECRVCHVYAGYAYKDGLPDFNTIEHATDCPWHGVEAEQ